jgi:ElaB/YqjD/DUF883 family membrane-anchored ribosome-binding protein
MSQIAYLNINLWCPGWLSDPKLYIVRKGPAAADETIQYVVTDSNGYPVTDAASTTFPASATVKEIPLGDYLDAQVRAKNLPAGFYFVLVTNVTKGYVWALPLIISRSAISAPTLDSDKLQYFTIFYKVLGTYINVPKTVSHLPADEVFELWAYYKDGSKGRLVKFDSYGNVVLDTGYHQLVILQLEIKFSSVRDMLYHMLAHSWGLTTTVAQRLLETIEAGEVSEALNLLKPFYSVTWIGRIIDYDFIVDDTKKDYRIVVKSSVFLGEWDWAKVVGWGLLGCGIAMAAVFIFAVATGGIALTALPLVTKIACVIGGAIGAGIAVTTSASTDKPDSLINYYDQMDNLRLGAKQKNLYNYNNAKQILDTWLKQGKITQDDYNQMMKVLDNWKTTMDQSIDEIVDTAKKAITEAYKKGVAESKTWIAVAGAGGLIVGLLLGRR